MSASKLAVWSWCQARFAFEYVEGHRHPPTPAMAIGTAVDRAQADGYRIKRDEDRDPDPGDVQERFAATWEESAAEVEDWAGEDRGGLKDEGARLVGKWARETAPEVRPHDVQQPFRLEVAGSEVRGVVDVTLEFARQEDRHPMLRGRFVVDHKVARRSWNESDAASQLQNVFYSFAGMTGQLADGTDPGRIAYEVLVRTKIPKRQRFVVPVGVRERRYAVQLIETSRRAWAAAWRAGAFVPNRGHFMCSRRQCPHWRRCEKEHGGAVRP